MHEADVRLALHSRLAWEAAQPETLVKDEVGLCLGEGRIDVAVINGRLAGYEIKSERDRLTRLDRQIDIYGRVLDSLVLVASERHVARALPRLPDWWGVWQVVDTGDGLRFQDVRRTGANPNVHPLAVAQLLWRDEAFDILRQRGLQRGLASSTRWRLWEALATELPLVELRAEVRQRLRARQDW